MTRRSRSSGRWLQEHFADPYVQRAQGAGWRSRAVFKLEEIDRRSHLLKSGAVCLDLGAAPGAWSQYARQRVGAKGRVVATDLLPMAELAGVEFVQGDFREEEVFERLDQPDAIEVLDDVLGGPVQPLIDGARMAVTLRRTRASHLERLRDAVGAAMPLLYVPELFVRSHGLRSTRQIAEALSAELGY